MDFDKKPGSRDGKPYKGRRKKVIVLDEKKDTIRVLPAESRETDNFNLTTQYSSRTSVPVGAKTNEYGMLEGVSYSLNKHGRWDMVDELKKKDDDEILVAEFDNFRFSTQEARDHVSNAINARKKKDLDEDEKVSKKDFSGKLKKEKTQSKKAQRKNQSRKEDAVQRAEATEIKQVYIVEKSLSRKEIQNSKQLVCDQGRATGCSCRRCMSWLRESDAARVNAKVDVQRDMGLK
jgi:hypothetical protein